MPSPLRRLGVELLRVRPVEALLLPHFLVGVVGVIVNDRDEVLLLRHTYRRTYPWGLPTGFLEHDEQPIDALRREIGEEAGFAVQVCRVWDTYVERHRGMNVVIRGEIHGEVHFRSSTEVSDARFFRVEELPAMIPDQRRLVDAYFREGGLRSKA